MNAQAIQYPSFSLLLPLWKKGEDFGMGSAFRQRRLYQSDGGSVDREAATIKPVLDVLGTTNPLKILGSSVGLVLISMVDKWKSKGIWDKGLRHKPVNGEGLNLSPLGKFNLWIPTVIRPIHADGRSDVSPPSATIDVPANTLHAADVADLVQPFVVSNRLPLFTRLTDVLNGWLDVWKQVLGRSLNVELFRFMPLSRSTEVDDKVSVVARQFEKSVVQRPSDATANTVISKTRNPSNSISIGNFVLPFVAWHRKPTLSFVFHLLSPLFPFLSNNMGEFRQNLAAGQAVYLASRIKEIQACQSR